MKGIFDLNKAWLKWVVLVITVGGFTAAGIVYTLPYLKSFLILKNNKPFQDSFAFVKSSPEVMAHLGSPVNMGLKVKKILKEGATALQYSVKGPDGKADVYVTAREDGGGWFYEYLGVFVGGTPPKTSLDLTFQMNHDYSTSSRENLRFIHLKNGNKMSAFIVSDNDNQVVARIPGVGEVSFKRKEIESVE